MPDAHPPAMPGLVDRPWLTAAVGRALADPACRIVLLTGPMGTGKSTFLDVWCAAHPEALQYALRLDSYRRDRSGAARDLLAAIATHFARLFPWLFDQGPAVEISQEIGQVAATGSVTGARIGELHAPPFAPPGVRVRQQIRAATGPVTAVEIGRRVWDPRLEDTETFQYLALLGPAVRAADEAGESGTGPLVVVVDALDELAGRDGTRAGSITDWLENCPPLPPALRLVISSRPGRHLTALRRVHQDGLREVSLAEHPADVADDLARYCLAALGGPPRDESRRRRRSAWIDQVVARAQGSFQFVVMLFRELADRGYDLARHDLALPALATVPDGLADLYDDLLRGLQHRADGEMVPLADGRTHVRAWPGVYEPVLGVLSTSAEPVTAEQIAAFANLPVPARVIRDALGRMDSWLARTRMADGSPGYAWAHLSLAEHLTGGPQEPGGAAPRSEFALDAGEWHARTAARLWRGTGLSWLDEQDGYRVRQLGRHLRGSLPADGSASDRLAALLQDPAFLARLIEVAGPAAALAEVTAGLPLTPDGPDQQALAELREVLSVHQGALRAGAEPLTTIANGLVAQGAAAVIAGRAWRVARQRSRPQVRLTQTLRTPRPPGRRQLGGFLGSLTGCAMDAAGNLLATAADDGLIRVWDRRAERELRAVRAGHLPTCCSMSGDGVLLAGGYADGTVAAWRADDGLAGTWPAGGPPAGGPPAGGPPAGGPPAGGPPAGGPPADGWPGDNEPAFRERVAGAVAGVAVNRAGQLVAADLAGVLTAWQLAAARHRGRLLWRADLDARLLCCALSSSGTTIAGDDTGALHVLSPAGRARIQAHDLPVRTCAISRDGSLAITGSYDATLAVWDVAAGRRVTTLRGHDSGVLGCALAAGASLAVSASLDGTCRLWDPASGRELGAWAPHDDHLTCCAVDDGGRWIVTGSADRTARCWPAPASPAARAPGSRHRGEIMQCALVSSGQLLVTAATDLSVRSWQPHDLTAAGRLLIQHSSPVTALAASTDASVVLLGDAAGGLILGRSGSWQQLHGDGAMITACALSGDGRTALTGDESGGIGLWRLGGEPRRIALPAAHGDWILGCSIDDAGTTALTADRAENSVVQCWDLTARPGGQPVRLPGLACAVGLPADGDRLTVALADGRVQVYDRSGGLLAAHHEPPGDPVITVGASPEGRRRITVHRSGRVSYWTGDQLDAVFEVPPPSGITLSDDLTRLVVGQSLGDLSVYDIRLPR